MNLTIVYESWRLHPLAWIHRVEAASIAAELRRAGHSVLTARFRDHFVSQLGAEPLLLRLSDPVMLVATRMLTQSARSYIGPSAAVLERCYDKLEAYKIASANAVDCPITRCAADAAAMPFPLVLKPRRGSDSLGVRIFRHGPLPERVRSESSIVQQQIFGAELTVAILGDCIGAPLRIHLPEGALYSFSRKYLRRPRRAPVEDPALAVRARNAALEIARIFGLHWAARMDLIHEASTDRLIFLECDAAPLVGASSLFAESLEAAGLGRAEQLQLLLNQRA